MSVNPTASYRPSWAVNMMLRLDESATVQTEPLADEFGTQLDSPQETPLVSAGGLEPLVLRKGRFSRVLAIRPRSASVESPATRQAGKFNLNFAYADLPIDPRLIRSASVEVYLGSVSASDFAAGVTGTFDGGRRVSQVKSTGGLTRADNLLMVGAVDTWKQTNAEKGAEIAIEGRDLRGLFLDGKPPLKDLAKLDLRQPIASVPTSASFRAPAGPAGVVNQLMALAPFGALVTIAIHPDDWPDGVVPSPGTASGATRVTLGAAGAGGATPGAPGQAGQQGASQSSRPSIWDLVTQYCFLVGAIPYFDGWTLRVRPAYTYFDLRQAGLDAEAAARRLLSGGGPALPTPFKDGLPRDVGEPEPLRIRRMVYGRDLKSLEFERKFQGSAKTPTIEVVGIDDTQRGMGKLITAQWPPKDALAAQQTKVSPSGEVAQKDTLKIPVHGIRDQARLLIIARATYEEVGRQELGGKAETANLASYGGDAADPDLCTLRTGDAVEFLVDVRRLATRSPLVSELADHTGRRDFGAEVDEVRRTLPEVDEDVARAIVASARGATLDQLRTFKVANVHYALATGGGTAIAFDFQNYVTLRQQVGAAEPRQGQRGALSKVGGRHQPQTGPTASPVTKHAPGAAAALHGGGVVNVPGRGPQVSPAIQQNVAATVDAVNAQHGVRR